MHASLHFCQLWRHLFFQKVKQENKVKHSVLPVNNSMVKTVRLPFLTTLLKPSVAQNELDRLLCNLSGGCYGNLCRTTTYERHRLTPVCSHMTLICGIIGLLDPHWCYVFMSQSGFKTNGAAVIVYEHINWNYRLSEGFMFWTKD